MDFTDIAVRYGKTDVDVQRSVEIARRSLVPRTKSFTVVEFGRKLTISVTRDGVGPLKTEFGEIHHFSFSLDDKWQKYSVLVMAPLDESFVPVFRNPTELVLRIDSGCETGQLFGDKTCECRDQLFLSMNHIREAGEGLIINIPRQDGRGLGLPFKLATLRIQSDLGVDTVVASALLDPDGSRDTRTYAGVVAILQFLNIPRTTTLHLESNNPEKMKVFSENGYALADLRPVVIPPTDLTRHHLEAKEKELGHINLVAPGPTETGTRIEWGWRDRVVAGIAAHNSHVCCGLDPDLTRFPKEFKTAGADAAVLGFFKEIVRINSQHVCAFKIQKAFFDELTSHRDLLREVIDLVHSESPCTPVILDCKVGDIENTMKAYMRHLFVDLNADAIVINPYMGTDVWQHLDQYPDRAAFVLVRTSNSGADCVQDVPLRDGRALWHHVLHLALKEWRAGRNVMPIISSNTAFPQDLVRDHCCPN